MRTGPTPLPRREPAFSTTETQALFAYRELGLRLLGRLRGMTPGVKILIDALADAGALPKWERLDQPTQSSWEKFVAAAIPVHQPARAANAVSRIERGKRPLSWPARIVYAFKESGVDSFPPASPGSRPAGSPRIAPVDPLTWRSTAPEDPAFCSAGPSVKQVPAAALYEDALRRAVHAALADHPAEAASVTEGRNERDSSVWGMEVEPANPSAASVYVTFAGSDEVTIGFGQTHEYFWDNDPVALAEYVGAVVAAVFAGDFEEAGLGDSFARVHLRDGTTVRVGNMHLPLPWRFRRTRRYAPLSTQRG